MNLIKKTISGVMALSMALGCFYANAGGLHKPEKEPKQKVSTNISLNGKEIVGGFSILCGVPFLGYLIYRHRPPKPSVPPVPSVPPKPSVLPKLPVLIIGGDRTDRQRLIERIHDDAQLAFALKDKLCEGGNYFISFNEDVAACGNWSISDCDIDDVNAKGFAEKSPVVIAIVDSVDSAKKLSNMLCFVHNRHSRAILTVVKDRVVDQADKLAFPEREGLETSGCILKGDYVTFWNTEDDSFREARNSTGDRFMIRGALKQGQIINIEEVREGIRASAEKQNRQWNNWVDHHS